MFRVALVLALAVTARAQAASLELLGPTVIQVGDTASFEIRIHLAPGERLHGAWGELIVEGGRDLALFAPYWCDCLIRDGFFTAGYSVDPAAIFNVTDDGVIHGPVLLEWVKDGPIDENVDPVPDYTPADGPFLLVPFSLTAIAPGELRLVHVPPGPVFPGWSPEYSPQDPAIGLSYLDAGGELAIAPIVPPNDGVWFRISVVPEPTRAGLLFMGAALIAARNFRKSRR